MNATTYTVDGVYTNMRLRIPPEDNIRYRYDVAVYDVSTTTYNAVLIHIINTMDDSEVVWNGSNSYVFPTTIQLPSLPIAGMDNVLIIVLHDGVAANPTQVRDRVNRYYAETDRTLNDRRKVYWPLGGYSILKKPHKGKAPYVPRVVGMTIIKRT